MILVISDNKVAVCLHEGLNGTAYNRAMTHPLQAAQRVIVTIEV
jgi:hypothetical protein